MTESTLNLTTMCKANWRTVVVAGLCIPAIVGVMVGHSYAQDSAPATSVQVSTAPDNPQPNTMPGAPQPITFADALQRARAIHPPTQAAFTAAGLAHDVRGLQPHRSGTGGGKSKS